MPQGLDEVSAVVLDDKMYMFGELAWCPQTSAAQRVDDLSFRANFHSEILSRPIARGNLAGKGVVGRSSDAPLDHGDCIYTYDRSFWAR